MTSKERLNKIFNKEIVDRPAVNFYEIGSTIPNRSTNDPYNVYSDSSWDDLFNLAEEKTDLMRQAIFDLEPLDKDLVNSIYKCEEWEENNSKFTKHIYNIAGKTLTSITRRDKDVDTIWTIKHLVEDMEDVKILLDLPKDFFKYKYKLKNIEKQKEELGDRGILIGDIGDPLCFVAAQFNMADYTIMALTEQENFHMLLEKFSDDIYYNVKQQVNLLPNSVFRICGSEYASEPYLPPYLYNEYEVKYTKPIVDILHKNNCIARLHSHGNLKNILPYIKNMNIDALDPIEPHGQGDVSLLEVKEYCPDLTLLGNIEISDIETLKPEEFEKKVVTAIKEGTNDGCKNFILMPSASPYGRNISKNVLENYKLMVKLANDYI